MKLGGQIAQAREAKHWSQEKLALALGVTRQAVVWWETNVNVPRKDKLERIEAMLDTRLSVTGSSMPHIPDVPADAIEVAMAFSRLTKPQRDAIEILIKGCLAGNKKKLS